MSITTKGASSKVNWLLAAGLSLAVATPLTATAASPPSGAAPSATASLPAAALQSPALPKSSTFAKELESKYIDPDRVYSSDVRWWLGEAAHTDETLLQEIQELYDAGFRGVELCMQNDNGAPNADYAYGSAMWTHKWNLMMNKLLDLDMAVYLTSGTNWATSNVPGLDPASQAAMQNVTLATGTVEPGAELTALPAPATNQRRAGASFLTAYAYRVVDGDVVDPESYIDLTPLVTQGADVWTQNLDWTAPSDGTYRVFSQWTQGTYQTSSPSAAPAYTTNYFDERGVEALRAFWEENYLADPALRAKILEGDVQLFMDSLEITLGSGITYWAADMAEEFQARKGYDITPFLFLLDGVQARPNRPYTTVGDVGRYRLDGGEDRRQRIVNDWQDVQTQLYRERMLQPLKVWLNSVGIKTRAQISYGKPIEISEPIMDVDYPEAENLNQYNQIDIFRYWTGGAKLENKVLSSETSAIPIGWNATYQTRLQDAYSQFAAGFQRTIWHVWAAEYGYGNNSQWPGFNPSPFAFLRFPLMGSRDPGSENYDEFNAHLGRVQQLMQTGESRTDVGFINQKWVHGMVFGGGTGNDNDAMNWQLAHQGIQYRSTELQDNGYTYDYFSPRFLFDDDVRFDERTKTIEKAGYKAVVLYQDWLDIHGARRLLNWAKRGLKVVILEDAASRTPFNDGKDGALKKVMDEMKTLPTVRQATVYDNIDYFSSTPGGYEDNVLEKLQELGVDPYSGYSEPNLQLLTQTRQDDDGNQFLYVYNYDNGSYKHNSHKPSVRNAEIGPRIETEIVQDGQFVPYSIDAWTGEVTEIADYRWVDGKTIVPIGLDYNDISLLAFEKVAAEKLHVLSTDADSARGIQDGVVVRSTESGSIKTELSNGTKHEDTVTVPQAYDITDWDLTVQSWRPNPTAGDLSRTETIDGLTTTNRSTSTVKSPIEVELDTLTTWNNIPEVGKAVSGEGHYEATFDWDADAASGAYLDFGDKLNESMVVWINGEKVGGEVSTNPTKVKKDVGGVGQPTIDDGTGQQVPLVGSELYTGGVNWMNPVVDVSRYLVDGENEIVIDYNSVLSNVQLDRGVMRPTQNASGWWGYHIDYLEFGPRQAKIVPFVELQYPKSAELATPGTPTPSPTTTPAPESDPDKVAARIGTKVVKPVEVNKKRRLRVTVRAKDAVPSGTVKVRVKGAGQKKAYTLTLNVRGRTKVWLPRFGRTGKVRVVVRYLGDADVRAAKKRLAFRVVQRRTVG